jgi:hypothetical protein
MSGFQRVEDNVAIRTGFIDRIDFQSYDLMAGYAWRYDKGLFKRLSFDVGGAFRQDSYGHPTEAWSHGLPSFSTGSTSWRL